MKFNKTFYQYLILLHSAAVAVCESYYYSIIAPGVLKSNRNYTVAVTLHAATAPCSINISILGRLFNATDQVDLRPFETKNLVFFPPKLDGSYYRLLAEGQSGCEFRNETKLFSDQNAGPKIYIQTDKSVYKPLDLVQFRTVILDEHTRPVNIREPIRVEIFDADNNRVKQFKDITLTKGVFTSKFNLSENPVMGDWLIQVTLSGRYSHQVSKKFLVRLYTLPKFSIYVDIPSYFILPDPTLRAEIYGKYTFDRYVEGSVRVELRRYSNQELIDEQYHSIDGLQIVEFQLENVPNLEKELALRLDVFLEEKQTKIQKNVTIGVSVRTERYKISIPQHEIEYRNNRPFRLKARIEDWNDGPVWDTNTPVTMEHGSQYYQTYLNDEGTAVFEFDYREGSSFTISFKDSKQTLPSFQLYQDKGEEFYFCKLKLKQGPILGKPVEVEVRSSFNIPYLVYIVVGHASIVEFKYIKVPSNRKTYTIKIKPSVEMIPTSFLYVHYIFEGNFRYEEMILNFPMELENRISIEAPKQTKPGQEVTLKVKAEPKSYVSILAVDLGVYLLNNDYDIYKPMILNDLLEDRSYVHDADIARPGVLSGLVTLTNGHHKIYNTDVSDSKTMSTSPLKFRKKFPETWIFQNYEINSTDTEIVLNIPDTVTTWRITAFSNNALKGFGVVDGPTDITTFLPYFISFDLPFSVKRGEVVVIVVNIFNYHNQSADSQLTMFNDRKQFEFMEPLANNFSNDQQIKNVIVPSNGGMSVRFLIKPIKIGELEIRIAANSSLANDGVSQQLRVVPEGITQHLNKARYLSEADTESFLTLDIPPDSVKDSEVITLSVGGDFMLPSLENYMDMVTLPTGCGEQNVANFAPSILILDYLKATGRLSRQSRIVREAKLYAEIGFQQELSYRHPNAGYSVFGLKGQEPSIWLTAYVIRFFIKASRYAPVEARIIDSGLEYLARRQWYDGSFPYTGYLFYKELQQKHSFTAFVLMAFLEDRRYSRKYHTIIRKGLDFINTNLDAIDDVYSLSLIAATFAKAKHSSREKVLEKLQQYRKEDKNNGLMWWEGSGNDVETTSYVLQALLDFPGHHLPILKWLMEQRNRQGGFRSSHDTVVGLETLVKFAKVNSNASSCNMTLSYSAQDHEGKEVKGDQFIVNKDNALVLQQHQLPKSVRRVNFAITGSGYSLVQLSSQFNIKTDEELKYFVMKVNPTIYKSEDLDLEVCFTYHALKGIDNSTNMVIMEANLPSGFKMETDSNQDLLDNDFVQRIELKNDETTMILYFDKLSTSEEHCVTIEAFKAHEVRDFKPSAIIMYDYYKTDRKNSLFYIL